MCVELVAQELQLIVQLEEIPEEQGHQVVVVLQQEVVHTGHSRSLAMTLNWNPKGRSRPSSCHSSRRSTTPGHRTLPKLGRTH